MNDDRRVNSTLPPGQEAIRAKCFHPTGTFVEFKEEDIDQSIPERFEQMVAKYRDRHRGDQRCACSISNAIGSFSLPHFSSIT